MGRDDYAKLVARLEAGQLGSSIAKSPQGELAQQLGLPIACTLRTFLLSEWLMAKKAGRDFWALHHSLMPRPDHLLRLNHVATEREHAAMLWQGALLRLSGHGLHLLRSASHAPNTPDLEQKLAEFAFHCREHFLVLSLPTSQTRHDLALFRPRKRDGKSRMIHVYDPNAGEFYVNYHGLLIILQAWLDTCRQRGQILLEQRLAG